jgi:hypothetical protein
VIKLTEEMYRFFFYSFLKCQQALMLVQESEDDTTLKVEVAGSSETLVHDYCII